VTYRLKPDGAKAGRLGKNQSHPVHSPDGSQYAFVSENGVLKRADGDGTHVKTVCAAKRVWQPAWK